MQNYRLVDLTHYDFNLLSNTAKELIVKTWFYCSSSEVTNHDINWWLSDLDENARFALSSMIGSDNQIVKMVTVKSTGVGLIVANHADYFAKSVPTVQWLYVDPAYRQKGVATFLIHLSKSIAIRKLDHVKSEFMLYAQKALGIRIDGYLVDKVTGVESIIDKNTLELRLKVVAKFGEVTEFAPSDYKLVSTLDNYEYQDLTDEGKEVYEIESTHGISLSPPKVSYKTR